MATFIQTCDWESNPEYLGRSLYTFQKGIPVDEEFPFACSIGLLGSADPDDQTSLSCGTAIHAQTHAAQSIAPPLSCAHCSYPLTRSRPCACHCSWKVSCRLLLPRASYHRGI